MQLKKNNQKTKKTNIKAALTMASCALLGTTADADENEWEFDTAVLFYNETDRVSAAEAMLVGTKEFDDEHFLNLKLTLDSLTGASANGAVAQPEVQTFSRPSGNGQYQVAASETPLDDTFKDTRLQLNAQWTQPIASDLKLSSGLHFSKEYDYLSIGLNSNLALDFNKKNATISVGLSHFVDTFTPEGGIPAPFEVMIIKTGENAADDNADASRVNSDNKNTTDILLGFTQVINRRMLMQINYSHSMVEGYSTDPFKVLSLVDNNGLTQKNLYEHRPGKRTKQSVYWQTKYHFKQSIFDFSYRYLWDDWNIKSHTIDSRFRFFIGNNRYIEPHIRYYQQKAAEFYRPFLNQNDALPEFASADYRIGEMTTYTLGLKYGTQLANGNELSFRAEYYSQNPTNAGFEQPGELANMELYPSIDAIVLQISYSF